MRTRLAVVAAVATATVLMLTVVLGLWSLRQSLRRELDDQVEARAEDTIELIFDAGETIDVDELPIPFGGDDTFAVAWDSLGALTRNDDISEDSLVAMEARVDETVTLSLPELTDIEGNESVRVAVRSLDDVSVVWDDSDEETERSDVLYVAVGISTARIDRLVTTLAAVGAGLVVVFTVFVGALVRWVTGRALRPVDRIRAAADEITATALDRRLVAAGDDELGRLTATLNGMLDRLQRSSETQRRFVSDASHELRNPVAAVAAGLEVSLRRPEDAEWETVARDALGEVRRIQRLVDDLLVLARSDEGGLRIAHELVDLDDVVLAQARAARAVTTVTIDTSAVSSATVLGDPLRLGQVVGNLVANATRHAHGAVALTVAERGDNAEVWVDDDGPGVAPEDRAVVFDRFARLDDSRRRDSGGAGLGLAICRALVVAHGGQIGVTESPLGGARFWFTLCASSADSCAG